MAIGAASVIAPAYIAEISPAAYRGRLGSLQQLAITVGIFVALLSDTLLARIAGGANDDLWLGAQAWRWMFIVAALPALLYVVSFGATWGPAVWVLLGEMFNNNIRALGLAVGAAAQWLANFTVTLPFPPLSAANVGLPYFIYSSMAVLSFVFVARAVTETKGRELEEM